MKGISPTQFVAQEIHEGILRRGFHILSHEELAALWPDEPLSGILRFQRIQEFAEQNGWEVAVRSLPSSALFQARGNAVRSGTTWRQSGAS